MFDKLETVEARYEELTKLISDPEVIANQTEWQKINHSNKFMYITIFIHTKPLKNYILFHNCLKFVFLYLYK